MLILYKLNYFINKYYLYKTKREVRHADYLTNTQQQHQTFLTSLTEQSHENFKI